MTARTVAHREPTMTLKSEFETTCPCCQATLVVDTNLKRVVRHVEPVRGDRPELSNAQRILADEAARREALFQQSVSAEKTRGDALSKPVRGGAAAGEPGADHEADPRLRSGLERCSFACSVRLQADLREVRLKPDTTDERALRCSAARGEIRAGSASTDRAGGSTRVCGCPSAACSRHSAREADRCCSSELRIARCG